MTDAKPPRPRKIKPPRGTRDLYPAEAARRRWLMERWREVSIRHGFEEVDGPTYENANLYAVKSGEGILGELFQAFSGKSPEEVEQVKRDGRAPYALRPEFTPTLARMYAAKANTLPKPCKWFMAGAFFRAERPQRGRLREFLQWNVDVLGLDVPQEKWYAEDAESRAEVAEAKARMDAECIACCVVFLSDLGLSAEDICFHISNRDMLHSALKAIGVDEVNHERAFVHLDRHGKMDLAEWDHEAQSFGLRLTALVQVFDGVEAHLKEFGSSNRAYSTMTDLLRKAGIDALPLVLLWQNLHQLGVSDFVCFDSRLVRGLAYYTGTVFEVIADGERSVAGGGRYDNLIELFGGPPTPAVGFAMGDVVLGLLLQDKGLMPSDDELLGLAGQHPDVFVLSNGSEEAEAKVRQVVAMLRRGGGREEGALSPTLSHDHSHGQAREREHDGLHVRHSYKATKKVDKLLAEAKKQHARFAVILEDAESCVVKDLRTGEQWPAPVALNKLHARLIEAL